MIRFKLNPSIERTPKPPKPETTYSSTETPKWEHLDTIQLVQDSARSVAKYVAIGVAGYMVLKTVSECAIKATPQR
jgi:hypothetical protein